MHYFSTKLATSYTELNNVRPAGFTVDAYDVFTSGHPQLLRAAGTPHAHVTRKPMECSGTLTGHWHQPRPHTHTDITTERDKCAENVDQEPWDLFTDDLWWDATDFRCPRLFEACWYEKASGEEREDLLMLMDCFMEVKITALI